jgi:hypothetical protein
MKVTLVAESFAICRPLFAWAQAAARLGENLRIKSAVNLFRSFIK